MKNLILFITLVVSSISYSQKHSVFGGNIEVTQIGSNQFIMSASVQIDSFNVSSMAINAFDNATDTFVKTFTISLDSSAIIPLRYQTHVIDSLYVNYLSDTFNLSNNPNGYYFVNNEFSKIKGLNNFENANYIFTCQIPNPSIPGGNSNPKFVNFNDSLYLLLGSNKILNFDCIDIDGDSLVFSFFQPYDSTSILGGKPFTSISFKSGHDLNNLLGPGALCGIYPFSPSYVIARAYTFNKYSLPVRCEEFRNGLKIGEVHRNLVFCPKAVYLSMKENNPIGKATIFPNPSNGYFTLSIEEYNNITYNLTVMDVTGKTIHNEQINSAQTTISLENLNKGIYFVQLNDGINQKTKRIVIQ